MLSIYFLRHLFYLRVHVLSTKSSFSLLEILFVRFPRMFNVPLTPPVSIIIAAPYIFSYIFTSDYNFGSFVSSLPGGLPFLPILFFSVTRYFIFILLPYLFALSFSSSLYSFNYSFNLCLLFKFLLFERILYDIRTFILVNDSYFEKNSCSFAHIFHVSSLISRLLLNQFYELSYIVFSRSFHLTNTPRRNKSLFFFPPFFATLPFHYRGPHIFPLFIR